jgi:hypothetical protein
MVYIYITIYFLSNLYGLYMNGRFHEFGLVHTFCISQYYVGRVGIGLGPINIILLQQNKILEND